MWKGYVCIASMIAILGAWCLADVAKNTPYDAWVLGLAVTVTGAGILSIFAMMIMFLIDKILPG